MSIDISKAELVGACVQDVTLAREPGYPNFINETPDAPIVRQVHGVVALLMEQDPPPATLVELRSDISGARLTTRHLELTGYVLMDLLDNQVLHIDGMRRLSYQPPKTIAYRVAVDSTV